MKENFKLKMYAKESGVSLWKIADRLRISQASFFIKLRYPLNEELEAEITKIITELKEGK